MARVLWVGPARNPATRPLQDAAYLVASAVFFAATWPGLAAARVRWAPPLDDDGDGPRLFLLPHARIWTAPALFRVRPAARRPALVAHDGARSRLNQRCGAWAGLDVVVFARHAQPGPVEQLARFICETGRDLVLAPDSGARPGTVRPGVAELARAAGARVIPLAVDTQRAASLGGQTLLLPGTHLRVRHGPALDASVSADVIGAALRRLEQAAPAYAPGARAA